MYRWINLIGLGLLVILLWRFGLSDILAHLAEADLTLLFVAAAGQIAVVALKALRWHKLLEINSVVLPYKDTFWSYWVGLYFGLVTPGRVGEFIKAQPVSRKSGASLAKVAPSILSDRLFDLYLLMIFGVVSFGFSQVGESLVVWWIIGGLSGVTGILALTMSSAAGELADRYGMGEWWTSLRNGLVGLSSAHAVWLLLLSALAYLVLFAQCIVIARAVGISSGEWSIVLAVVVGNIAALLPVSVSGLGTRDAAIFAVLSVHGVGGGESLGFSLTLFIILNVFAAIVGGAAAFTMRGGEQR